MRTPLPSVLATLAAGLILATTSAAQSETPLTAQLVVSGLDGPVHAEVPPGDIHRLFIVEHVGRIRVLQGGALLPTPFLDLTSEVYSDGLMGMLGFAFHPDYVSNGLFYVSYAVDPFSAVLVRYSVSATDPDLADPASATVLVGPVSVFGGLHQGGAIVFDDENKLYFAIGSQREVAEVECGAQSGQSLVGKLLRLNDDGTIPADNPFVGDPTVRDEIWALGLRQPYRMFYDLPADELYIADVGNLDREEINIEPSGSAGGANYGWRVMEGSLCTGAAVCAGEACPDPGLTPPAYEYAHPDGCCVAGGVVYRGAAIPSLQDAFLFSDLCGNQFQFLRQTGGTVTEVGPLGITLPPDSEIPLIQVVAFAHDAQGEVLLVDHAAAVPGFGSVYRLVPTPAFQSVGAGLSGTPGVPVLTGNGTLQSGTNMSLSLFNALPDAAATLVVGLSELSLPFHGGTLVPNPTVLIGGLVVGGGGSLVLPASWPVGVPPGVQLYAQAWIEDAAAVKGLAASNGVLMTTP